MLIRKEFEQIQKTTGFNLELLEKAYHLTRVLNEMQKQPVLRENLTLKGGTALNFKKLNELAQSENCNVNELISILIREHKKAK